MRTYTHTRSVSELVPQSSVWAFGGVSHTRFIAITPLPLPLLPLSYGTVSSFAIRSSTRSARVGYVSVSTEQ